MDDSLLKGWDFKDRFIKESKWNVKKYDIVYIYVKFYDKTMRNICEKFLWIVKRLDWYF